MSILPWRAPAEIDADLDEELQFHLEQRIAEQVARGMTPAAAREEALRRFGNLADARAYCRAVDRGRARQERRRDWRTGWGQDLRFALRQLLRAPGFTLIAVLTIGLGVGANTAIFSAVHRLLLNPLPFPGGDRLVALLETSEKSGIMVTPAREVVDIWRAKSRTLEGIEAYDERTVTLSGSSEPERMSAVLASGGLPSFLGATLPLGRYFAPEELVSNGPHVVVLGHGLWQRRFGGRTNALGETLEIDGKPYTVIGVMPTDFTIPSMGGGPASQLWLPLPPGTAETRRQAVARLRPGVTPEQATAELGSIETAYWKDKPNSMAFTGKALRPQEFLAGPLRQGLLVLFGVVGVVLLIACANVANLLLARAATRSHEFAIRTALGAGRGRLVRQLLTESTLLALLGGALGIFLAARGLDLLRVVRPSSLDQLDDVRLQPVALLWSLGLTLVTGLVFGLAPALLSTDRQAGGSIRGLAGTSARSPRRLRSALVVLEVALSVTLLVGAGLLVRTLVRMQQVQPGFSAEGVTAFTIAPPAALGEESSAKPNPALPEIRRELAERVRAIPGVEGVALSSGVPPRMGVAFGELEVEGKSLNPEERPRLVGYSAVSPGYFAALGVSLVAGRTFEPRSDTHETLINEGMARRFWPGEDAVGKRFRLGERGEWLTVIGVVSDIRIPGRQQSFDSLQTYSPISERDGEPGGSYLLVRSRGDRASITRQVRAEVGATAGALAITEVNAASDLLDEVLQGPRFTMLLFAGFAGLALLLAAIGLYGVVSYSVSQRTREIGVRMALGAGRLSVIRMVLWQGLGLTLLGVVLGLAGAAAATRAMQSLLFGVSRLDPLTFAVVGAGLIAVALVAAWVPARRAVRVDPAVALRGE